MFEIARYLLTLIVADTHLWPVGFGWSRWQAVFGFYTLSGYLMTRVLHERYCFAWPGTAAFLANRVLRLWPAYLVVIAGTGLVLCFYPLDSFFQPDRPAIILGSSDPRPSWGRSGSIELVSYCLLALYFARTAKRLMVLATLGAVGIALSTGHCVAVPSPYNGPCCAQNRYGVVQVGFIPFAVGGLAYFHRGAMQAWLTGRWRWVLAVLLGAEVLVGLRTFTIWTIGPFIGVGGMLALIVWCGGDRWPSPAVDFIGRASYHLFLAHMSIAAILIACFGMTPSTFPVFALSLALALGLSGFLVPLEWRLNRLRGHVLRLGRRPGSVAEPGHYRDNNAAFSEQGVTETRPLPTLRSSDDWRAVAASPRK